LFIHLFGTWKNGRLNMGGERQITPLINRLITRIMYITHRKSGTHYGISLSLLTMFVPSIKNQIKTGFWLNPNILRHREMGCFSSDDGESGLYAKQVAPGVLPQSRSKHTVPFVVQPIDRPIQAPRSTFSTFCERILDRGFRVLYNDPAQGEAPITKNGARETTRGMTPIEKNVIVVDEKGNQLTPTWAKRAKGLVKQGRARWLDENMICLACPPDRTDLEDMVMKSADMENTEAVNVGEAQNAQNSIAVVTAAQSVTAADILARIDRITEQGERLFTVIGQIRDLPVNESGGGRDGAERAAAIGNIISAREETNQKMVDLLSRMYDDIVPRKLDRHDRKTEILDKIRMMNFDAVHPEAVRAVLDFFEHQLKDD